MITLLQPARRLSGEVIKLRGDDGRITGTVCTETERHYSTAGLLAAEVELVTRAQARQDDQVAIVPDTSSTRSWPPTPNSMTTSTPWSRPCAARATGWTS